MQIWQNFLAAIKQFLNIQLCRKNIYGSKINKTQGVRTNTVNWFSQREVGYNSPPPRQTAIQPSTMAADFKRLLVLENTRIWKLRCDAFKSCTKEVLSVWSSSCCTAGQPQSSVRTETNSRGAAPGSHCVNMAWWEPSKTRGRSSAHAIVSEKNSNNTGTCVTLEQRVPLRIKTRRWWCHKHRHTYLDL